MTSNFWYQVYTANPELDIAVFDQERGEQTERRRRKMSKWRPRDPFPLLETRLKRWNISILVQLVVQPACQSNVNCDVAWHVRPFHTHVMHILRSQSRQAMTVKIQISTHGKNKQLHLLLTVMSIPPNQITANIADVFGLECEAVSLFVDFNGACIPFFNRRGECSSESFYHACWNSDDPCFIVLIIVIVVLSECWRWVIAYKMMIYWVKVTDQ